MLSSQNYLFITWEYQGREVKISYSYHYCLGIKIFFHRFFTSKPKDISEIIFRNGTQHSSIDLLSFEICLDGLEGIKLRNYSI